jgi:hypothetical protein
MIAALISKHFKKRWLNITVSCVALEAWASSLDEALALVLVWNMPWYFLFS